VRKTIGFITTALVISVSLALAAQARQRPTAQAPAVVRITVTGCVEPSAQPAGDAIKIDTKYVLSDAKPGQNGQASRTGSTSGSSPSGTYRLNARDATLGPQVGHQVEIVAVVEEPGTPTPVGTSGSPESTAKAPKLRVERIKMVSATCPK